ncbi:hypothetical protein R5P06_03965 [Candidatus Thioglobus autotrophicus]|uniref:hypothetical protein n=1 Tax=Candidatus Thioglobus autotrophicus TaxID=1705394 RepID=UPI00299F162F|nr:hypothetical protein [Candidatus Thioglobus autotrophicus]WPE17230.1 hypothetical protein R5P06_03965 [Candidatus Thioglobus autotrophicus]
MTINKTMLGVIVALLSFVVIAYAVETDRSLVQLFIGFILFIIPVVFISSFNSSTGSFVLVIFTTFFSYGMYKYEYYGTLFGLLLAIIIGGSIAYFRVEKYKVFSAEEYKKEANSDKEND